MRKNRRFVLVSAFVMSLVAVLALGCSTSTQGGESVPREAAEQVEVLRDESSGEHSASSEGAGENDKGGEGADEHGVSSERAGESSEGAGHREGPGPGEESGQALALDDAFDAVRNGARLSMVYDPESTSFKGVVGNTTGQTLCRVRVEVHLSSGTELGPTTPTDLRPDGELMVDLSAAGEGFDGWSAHAEMSPCDGGEGSGEHGLGGEQGEGDEHGEGGEHGDGSD